MKFNATLVVMAAGMGSRFGGLKQMEPISADGRVLLDFSVYDAKKAGFTKIVFVIKEFIVHDMYLIDVEENLVEQMKYIYGKGFKRLKDKVLGANATYMIH